MADQTLSGDIASNTKEFFIGLPSGFVELPLDQDELTAMDAGWFQEQVSTLFGVDPSSEASLEAAGSFAGLGTVIGATGIEYAALAFYKSPEDDKRPIMILLGAAALASAHYRQSEAISGLLELHNNSEYATVEEIRIPVGPAVATVSESKNEIPLGSDDETFAMTSRQVTAWVPDAEGSTIGVVSLMTNSYQDWEHVCRLALDIFDSFEWSQANPQ